MIGAVVLANAKINLTLDILGKRDSGYHNVEMIMQSIDLADEVTITLTGLGDITVCCNDPLLPQGKGNLAYKAAQRFFELTEIKNPGLLIDIKKHIPFAAGLAGGSADAAAVIYGLNNILNAGQSENLLAKIGVMVGADLPFCLKGGTMLAQGIGEVLSVLPPLPDCFIAVVKPLQGISTAGAYAAYDLLGAKKRPDTQRMIRALECGNLEDVASGLCNVLEEVAAIDSIEQIKAEMLDIGALSALMSGSGSAVFGIFNDAVKATDCVNVFKGRIDAFLCKPAKCGLQLKLI